MGGPSATLVTMPSELAVPDLNAQTYVGDRSSEVYSRLLKERIVFLGSQVDDASANLICAQLLLLQSEDPERDVYLYINSPGGSVSAGMAIYDTMQYISCDVGTICLGLAASMGQFLLCAGAPGKRYALPHSRVLMHQPSAQMQGTAVDIAIHAKEIVYTKKVMAERIAYHTGQSVEQILIDSDRDRWFTAEEARDYGIIDHVIERSRQVAA
jgi:ATP-dependent Clp protease, protease subunit